MEKEKYYKFLKEMQEEEMDLTLERNGEYSSQTDALSNFRRYNEVQFLSRMYEKFCRIENDCNTGKNQYSNKLFKDACQDLSNYAHLLLAFCKEKEENAKNNFQTTTPLQFQMATQYLHPGTRDVVSYRLESSGSRRNRKSGRG